jgi:hypothetical protein
MTLYAGLPGNLRSEGRFRPAIVGTSLDMADALMLAIIAQSFYSHLDFYGDAR